MPLGVLMATGGRADRRGVSRRESGTTWMAMMAVYNSRSEAEAATVGGDDGRCRRAEGGPDGTPHRAKAPQRRRLAVTTGGADARKAALTGRRIAQKRRGDIETAWTTTFAGRRSAHGSPVDEEADSRAGVGVEAQ